MHLLEFDVFTHVVQCTSNKDSKTPYTCDYEHLVYCYDDADSQIKPHFPGTVEFIRQAELSAKNGASAYLPVRVMVHCKQGVSRSASCTVAYLMEVRRMTLRDALALVKKGRECICVNQGFAEQLLEYEKELRGSNSITFKQMVKNEWASPVWNRGNKEWYN